MIKLTRLEAVTEAHPRIALGQFDGVHLGHRVVIGHGRTVVSFDPHPQAVLAPQRPPVLLSPLPRKLELLERAGVAELVVVPFDRERAAQSPAAFIEEVLIDRLGAEEVSVGANFRFGHRARGNVAMLEADPRFATRALPLIEVEGETVSSSRIRRLVAEGDVPGAARLLGSAVEVRGTVLDADGEVQQLRFSPTSPLPPRGTYHCTHGSRGGQRGSLRVFGTDPGGPLTGELSGFDVAAGEEIALELVNEPRAPAAYAARRRAFAPHM